MNVMQQALNKYIDAKFNQLFNLLKLSAVQRAGHRITGKEAEAGRVEIDTQLSKPVNGHIIQIYRYGFIVTWDAYVCVSSENKAVLVVENGPDYYRMESGDVIAWLVW